MRDLALPPGPPSSTPPQPPPPTAAHRGAAPPRTSPASARNDPVRLNMTPMIDVVFQLIVFFLVSMKFKTLDMKIDAFLPPDRGPNPTDVRPPEVPTVTAVLKRASGETATRVRVANATLGVVSESPERAGESRATLARLGELAVAARRRAGDGVGVRGEIDAAPLVPTSDVIRTVDAFLAAGLADVTFVGTPQPGTR